jgi:UDPglucose 6-dehydrogenase
MRVGVLGLGVIGSAHAEYFSSNHEVYKHDIKFAESSIKDLLITDVIFVCLPTPAKKTGECDVTVVVNELKELISADYSGVVIIKSTISPDFSARYKFLFNELDIAIIPEFLRERCALEDLTKENFLIVGGASERAKELLYDLFSVSDSEMFLCTYEEASLIKYFHNTFNAMRVVFANQFSDLCNAVGNANYTQVLDGICKRNNMKREYLQVSEQFKGYSGPCLPKDTKAMGFLAEKLVDPDNIWITLERINNRYDPTVPDGMRK